MKLNTLFPAAVLVPLVATHVSAAISYTTIGASLTENFNSGLISANGTSGTWANDSTLPGWSVNFGGSAPSEYYASNGTGAQAGQLLSLGSNNNADRAFGSSSANSGTDQHQISVSITNTTTIPLTEFTVNYTGELWRAIGAESSDGFIFHYRIGEGSWIAVAALDWSITYPTPSGSTNKNGNLAENRSLVTGTVSGINWADGETLTLRWTDFGTGGANQAQIGIDDFSFSAVPEPSAALLGFSGMLVFLTKRRR